MKKIAFLLSFLVISAVLTACPVDQADPGADQRGLDGQQGLGGQQGHGMNEATPPHDGFQNYDQMRQVQDPYARSMQDIRDDRHVRDYSEPDEFSHEHDLHLGREADLRNGRQGGQLGADRLNEVREGDHLREEAAPRRPQRQAAEDPLVEERTRELPRDRWPTTNEEAQEVAERLSSLATRIDDVNHATAVVVGRWAVVAIDVDAELDRNRVGSIKYTVAEALKEDPLGAYSIVTADPDVTHRIAEMNEEIRDGRPLIGVMDELADIVGRIMPQVPREVPEPEGHPEEQTEFDEQDVDDQQQTEVDHIDDETDRQLRDQEDPQDDVRHDRFDDVEERQRIRR